MALTTRSTLVDRCFLMAAQRVSQTQCAGGTQSWPVQPSDSQRQSPPGVVASQRVGSGQRPVDFLRYIKLPQDYARLTSIIHERPHPLTDEARAAKAQELIDLRAAILSSPDLNAWRQGISPEAYRSPTKFGGTDPREPNPGYIKLPYLGLPKEPTARVIEAWILSNHPALTSDRIAADGKLYTFRDNTPAKSGGAPAAGDQYARLIKEIETRYSSFAGCNRMPDEGKWPKPMGQQANDLSDTPARLEELGISPPPGLSPRF